jgi:hypothetical protein
MGTDVNRTQADEFATHFNAGDADLLAALLAPDATAKVIDAPFPEEQGRGVIRATSIPHILELEPPVTARVEIVEAIAWVLLVRSIEGDGALDMAIRITANAASDAITRLEYLTAPNAPERLAAIATACGLTPATA